MSDELFAGHRMGAAAGGMVGQALRSAGPQDELLHPPAASGHYSSSETSYFGFNIPEKALNGEIYVWFHPVLRVMSASVYIWRGLKSSTLSCEYVNHYHFLPWPQNDIADYVIDGLNLHIKVLEPMKSILIEFADKARNVSFVCRQDAIMPSALRPDGYHFTQAMKTTGELNLYGERFVIDGFFSRDRSWGQERRETPQPLPPLSWMVGVFDANFAFHVMAHDDPALGPEWAQRFPNMTSGKHLYWGYIYQDGETTPVKAARKLTHREPDGLAPRCIEMEIEDARSRQFSIRGFIQARMPWQTWQNMNTFFCQTRWECQGKVGWGDTQDVQFNEFTHAFAR